MKLKLLHYNSFSQARKNSVNEVKQYEDMNKFVNKLVNKGWSKGDIMRSYNLSEDEYMKYRWK